MISIRELRDVRLLLAENFVAQEKDRAVQKLLLWEDNMAVVGAIGKMAGRSVGMVAELRKLHRLLHSLSVYIDARWLPSAVGRYADRLSRRWNLSDVGLTEGRVCYRKWRERSSWRESGFGTLPLGTIQSRCGSRQPKIGRRTGGKAEGCYGVLRQT